MLNGYVRLFIAIAFHLHKIIQNRGLLSVCLPACLAVLLMNKTSTNSLIFYFDKAKQKNVCSDIHEKNLVPKYFVFVKQEQSINA